MTTTTAAPATLFLTRKQHDALLDASPALLRQAFTQSSRANGTRWSLAGVRLTLPTDLADELNGHPALDSLTQQATPGEREERPAFIQIDNESGEIRQYDRNDPRTYLRAALAVLDQPAAQNAPKILATDIAQARAWIAQAMDLQQPSTAAKELARAVDNLNPRCNEIGAGYMANMRDLAKKIFAA